MNFGSGHGVAPISCLLLAEDLARVRGRHFAPAETWMTVMRTLVGKNFSWSGRLCAWSTRRRSTCSRSSAWGSASTPCRRAAWRGRVPGRRRGRELAVGDFRRLAGRVPTPTSRWSRSGTSSTCSPTRGRGADVHAAEQHRGHRPASRRRGPRHRRGLPHRGRRAPASSPRTCPCLRRPRVEGPRPGRACRSRLPVPHGRLVVPPAPPCRRRPARAHPAHRPAGAWPW